MMLLICGAIFSQSYTASNGVTYNVGDTLTIGVGSNPDGSFKFVEMSGAKALLMYDQNSSGSLSGGKNLTGLRFAIKKIKAIKYMGNTITVLYLERNFAVQIENALKVGEV